MIVGSGRCGGYGKRVHHVFGSLPVAGRAGEGLIKSRSTWIAPDLEIVAPTDDSGVIRPERAQQSSPGRARAATAAEAKPWVISEICSNALKGHNNTPPLQFVTPFQGFRAGLFGTQGDAYAAIAACACPGLLCWALSGQDQKNATRGKFRFHEDRFASLICR